ncbi:MAG: phosphoribosylformylglycinamidine synthase subunit PurL, partial [Pseudonocardiales bacterium]|nr:phosphoribosylformylglycinamidine synthase subunit PurL [Pseudonocardiales bacterium]
MIDAEDQLAGSRIDSVEVAATTTDQAQPYAELGLRAEEYQRILDIIGRRPTDA